MIYFQIFTTFRYKSLKNSEKSISCEPNPLPCSAGWTNSISISSSLSPMKAAMRFLTFRITFSSTELR